MHPVTTNEKRTILVTGGAGAQGGSVARALLRQKKYHVRLLTRNPRSHQVLVLQRAGAEIVTGDLVDKESLIKALQGSDAVFGATNFWADNGKEYELGKNLIDSARESGTRHIVIQTLPSYGLLSHDRYPVAHYESLARLEQYARSLSLPSTFVQAAFYYENFLDFFPLQKDDKGGYYFGFPQGDTKMAMVSVEDLGPIVATVFEKPEDYIGKTLGVVGDDRTNDEYAAILSEQLNKNIYYTYVPRNIYAAYNIPAAEEWANMFEVQRLYVPGRGREMEESYQLNPSMQSFETWVRKNKEKFFAYFNTLFEAVVI